MSTSKIVKRKPRAYHKITAAQLAQFKALKTLSGNGSAAIRQMQPELLAPHGRAWKMVKKIKEVNATEFIDDQLQLIGVDSIQRLGLLVNSTDERVAQKSVHFTIEQIRGKATQKSIALTGKLNVQDVLE